MKGFCMPVKLSDQELRIETAGLTGVTSVKHAVSPKASHSAAPAM